MNAASQVCPLPKYRSSGSYDTFMAKSDPFAARVGATVEPVMSAGTRRFRRPQQQLPAERDQSSLSLRWVNLRPVKPQALGVLSHGGGAPMMT